MRPKPPTPLRTPFTVTAVALSAIALAVVLVAHFLISRAGRMADAVAAQGAVAEAYERRALLCLDQSEAALADPGAAERAERSLNISGGITLCLVRARDDARLDEAALEACISELEAANLVPGTGADGAAVLIPAC
jgi:hypothetical protein